MKRLPVTDKEKQIVSEDEERIFLVHCWNNRAEVQASARCLCGSCDGKIFPASDVNQFWEEKHACCPSCGLTGCVLGDASGIPFEDVGYLNEESQRAQIVLSPAGRSALERSFKEPLP